MLKADLHIHSTVSDGSMTIDGIIDEAIRKGLDAIAITDHDTLSQTRQIMASGNMKIIPGLEISAMDFSNSLRVHVLGYHIQAPEIVEQLTQPLLEARHQNTLRQIAILKEHGYEIDINRLNPADGKYLYKQHVMDYLVSTGQAAEMFGFFYNVIFKNNGICHFDIKYIDVFDAVKAIKDAGGFAVLAHPGQQQNFYLIPELKQCGLDGVELHHHTHSAKDKDTIRECCARYGLFMTGGSDYHGKYEPQPFGIGDLLCDESGVAALC
jgi:phosphoribosyl 1,2-cyclic phosphate 1,2-diphosphodiesterase